MVVLNNYRIYRCLHNLYNCIRIKVSLTDCANFILVQSNPTITIAFQIKGRPNQSDQTIFICSFTRTNRPGVSSTSFKICPIIKLAKNIDDLNRTKSKFACDNLDEIDVKSFNFAAELQSYPTENCDFTFTLEKCPNSQQ